MWVPEEGDLIWLDFGSTQGREQTGRRPAIVLSSGVYNRTTGLAAVCPITSKRKGFPLEVDLGSDLSIQGVVLVDHIRSVSFAERHVAFIEAGPDSLLREVRAKLTTFLRLSS